MRYKVPQNVQREDQILWFLTLRQLIILIVGFAISYGMFNFFNKHFHLYEIQQVIIWIPMAIAAAFAFIRFKGVSLTKLILLLIEQSFFRPPNRRWVQLAGSPFVSMTTPFSMNEKKKDVVATQAKDASTEKIKNLAAMLDGEKGGK